MESKVIFNNIKEYFLSKPKFISRIFFVVLISAAAFALFQQYKYLKEVEKSEANLLLKKAENSIEQSIHSALLSTITLALSVNDDGIPEEFESLGRQLVDENLYVDGIELVPNGIVKYVYPYETNKSALNYDILADQKTNREANNAINNKKFYIAGPLVLKQGGAAVIGRLPIFRNNQFWGFSAVIVKLETLFKNTGINTPTISGFYYQFSKVNPNTLIEENFLPIPPNANTTYLARKKFQESNWIITVIPIDKYGIIKGLFINSIIYLLMALGFSTLLKNLLSRPAILEQLVLERTKELKNSKKEIQDSEENYRTMVERISDAFVAFDSNWNCTYVNKLAAEIFSKQPEQLIGKNIWEVFPEGIEQPFHLAYKKAMNEQTFQYLLEYYPPYNKWFENHIYPSTDGLSIYFKDVTEKIKNDAALQKTRANFESIFNNTVSGFLLMDVEYNILSSNTRADELLEMALGDATKKSNNLLEMIPENRKKAFAEQHQKVLDGETINYEVLYTFANKDNLWFDISSKPVLDTSNEIIGISYSLNCISERKKAEEKIAESEARLKEAQAIGKIGSWEIDMIKNNQIWSDELYSIFGFIDERPSPSIDFFMSFIHPNDLSQAESKFKNAFETISNDSFEFRFISNSGQLKYAYIEWNFTINEEEIPSRMLGIIRDITERKKTEKKLEDQYNELQKTNQELDRFVYSASHDLRAPLKSMLGLIGITNDSLPQEFITQKDMLSMLNKSVLKLDGFIEDILNYSRNARLDLIKQEINFEQMLAEILEGLRYIDVANGIEPQLKIDQHNKFISDNRRIQVVLNNLITNAIKYSDKSKEKPSVIISIECDKDNAFITIEDNGIGIAKEDQEKIFEMFYRATKLSTGSGLGLYIVKETLEKLHASIQLDSTLNKGTKIKVTIPNQYTTIN